MDVFRPLTLKNGTARLLFMFFVLVFPITLLGGCSDGVRQATPTTFQVPVDPLFKELYQTLGGEKALGPAISPQEERDNNLRCQFTERVLMCFNSAATDANRYVLYPLGKDLKLREDIPLEGAMAPEGARVVDGFVIYDNFVPLYDQLYGARYVGRPLTQVRINTNLNRVEQFFENVGFAQSLADPNAPVELITYGAYFCGHNCSTRPGEIWNVIGSNMVEQPFAGILTRIGGTSIFGTPKAQPNHLNGGGLEQVYSNAILYYDAASPGNVRLRPLPLMLGYKVEALVPKKSHELLVFYEMEPGLGYNVPKPFDTFIALHGGPDLSGKPISEVVRLNEQNLYQQCFENYCLLYDPTAKDALNVRMLPLGEEYLRRNPVAKELEIVNIFSPDRIGLNVWVDRPNLSIGQEQFIHVMVSQIADQKPIDRVEGNLVLNLPDGSTARYVFPPTNEEGKSVVTIPFRDDLKKGDRLNYTVCLNLPSDQPICTGGTYLIWNTP